MTDATPPIRFGNAAYGFREYGFPEFFEACHRIGTPAVEIDAGWFEEGEAKNRVSLDATARELDRVKELATAAGVQVTAIGSGAVVGLAGEVAEDRSAEIMKAVDIAEVLGAQVIRVFTEHDFTHSKHYVLTPDRVTDALYETLAIAFNKLGDYLKGKGIRVGIENHGGTSATGAGLKKLLDMVPHREIGVTFDPANYAFGGEDPYQALLAVQDRVVYTHWKDVAQAPDKPRGVEYRAFGEGEIDWSPIIGTLLDSFDGIWAIEYERKEASTLENLAEGTRRSKQNLAAAIEQVRNAS
ncbi:MAG: sugar phosphate isomerase/epimerase [Acidobacteriota bacterium]|nr:sugar phosphate isomerase/epimerase [Acidobacteriota bacterium]